MYRFGYLHRYIDQHEDLYVKRLADSVAIQSVSAWPDKREAITEQIQSVADVGHPSNRYSLCCKCSVNQSNFF